MGIRFNSGMDAWITNGIVVVCLVNHSLVECLFGSVVFAYEYSAPLLVFFICEFHFEVLRIWVVYDAALGDMPVIIPIRIYGV